MRHSKPVPSSLKLQIRILLKALTFVMLLFSFVFNGSGQSTQQERFDEIVRMMKEAMSLLNEGSRDSLVKSRDLYRAIAKKPKGDALDIGLGMANFYSGLISSRLGENPAAVREYSTAIPHLRAANDERTLALSLNNLALLLDDRNRSVQLLEEATSLWRKIGDTSQTCNSQINLAAAERNAGRPQRAIDLSIEATTACEESGNKRLLATLYEQSGSLYLGVNDLTKAIAFYKKGLTLVSELNNKELEGLILNNLGEAYFRSGDYAGAKESFEKALSLQRTNNDLAISSFRGLATTANAMRRYDEVIKYGEECLQLLRQTNSLVGQPEILNLLSYAYSETGQKKKAFEALTQARDHFKSQNRPYEEAHTYFVEGILFESAGKLRDALKPLRRAYESFTKINEKAAAADSLQIIGRVRHALGDTRGGLKDLEEVIAIYRSLNYNKIGEHQTLMTIALINLKLGNLDAASIQASETERYGQETKNKDLEAAGLLFKGIIELLRNNFVPALDYVNRAEGLMDGASNQAKVVSLSTLGSIYISLGLTKKAREVLERSSKLIPEGSMKLTLVNNLLFIGQTYANEKQWERAIEYTDKSCVLASKLDLPLSEAICFNNIGAIYARQKQNKKAIDYYDQALLKVKDSTALSVKGPSLANLGWAYAELEGNPKAIPYLNQALNIAHILGSKELEAATLGGFAMYWRKQKNRELTIFYGKQAVNLIQSIRHSIRALETEYQQAYIDKFAEDYRMFADTLIEYGQIAEAEKVLAMLKEQEYFDFLRRDGRVADELLATLSLTPEEQEIFQEYKKFANELTALGREFGELEIERNQYEPGKFPKEARFNELEGLLSKANTVFAAFLDQLKLRLGSRDVRVNVLESGNQALLKELKEPRTVFISTIASENRLNIIVTTADTQKAYASPVKETELNKLVADFRSALRSPRLDPRKAGKALFDVLFPGGLSKDLEGVKAETVVWSLDGTLRYVPISALWDGEKYLVERFNNVVITLASRDKINAPRTERTNWRALGVGVSKETSLKENDGTTRTFEALTSVPEELCTVIADRSDGSPCRAVTQTKVGSIEGKAYLDEGFTLQNFKDSVGRYPVVHIASHFSLNPGNENDSYLLLGAGPDRRLTLASIRQGGTRFVGVDLLTLSACNTGMSPGNTSNGIEIEGFGALAQRSGAKSVLASLWPVADTSTRDLMVEFYARLNSNPSLTKAEALRGAQLKLLNGKYGSSETPVWRKENPNANKEVETATRTFPRDSSAPFAHPYYWSPFILIGNWR